MALLVFLNERSCESESTPAEVADAMGKFIDVLKQIRTWRELKLVTKSPLPQSQLASGYYYGQWCGDKRNKTRHQYILALRNRQPSFAAALRTAAAPDAGGTEHRHNGQTVEGIGAARLAGGLAVSLPLDDAWKTPWLEVDVEQLSEDANGELVVENLTDSVRHAAEVEHLDVHEAWGRSNGLDTIGSPIEMWEKKTDFFPNLEFLHRVQDDLENLDPKWFKPARRLLAGLEASAAGWDPVASHFPDWQAPHITPEHEGAKRDRWWVDFDGISRCFDMHGRMNRDAGRIYFRLVPELKTIRIAYIGPHL